MTIMTVQQLVLAALIGLIVWAMVCDVRTLTIPNRIALAIVALWPAWLLANWGTLEYPGPLAAIGVAGLMLLFGYVLFAANWVGGGDVKFLTALALWAGPQVVYGLVIFTAVAGGVLALGALGFRLAGWRLAWARDEVTAVPAAGSTWRVPVPYGVAIGVGGLYVAMALSGFLG